MKWAEPLVQELLQITICSHLYMAQEVFSSQIKFAVNIFLMIPPKHFTLL